MQVERLTAFLISRWKSMVDRSKKCSKITRYRADCVFPFPTLHSDTVLCPQSTEQLDKDNKWRCPSCSKMVCAKKRYVPMCCVWRSFVSHWFLPFIAVCRFSGLQMRCVFTSSVLSTRLVGVVRSNNTLSSILNCAYPSTWKRMLCKTCVMI